MNRPLPIAAFATAVAVSAAAALWAAPAATDPEPSEPSEPRRVMILHGSGQGHPSLLLDTLEAADTLVIEDAGDLQVGQTQYYWTEQGRRVELTRDEGGALLLDVDGKEIRITAPAELGAMEEGTRRFLVRREGDEGARETKIGILRARESGTEGDDRPLLRIELLEQEESEGEARARKLVLVVPIPDGE